MGKVGLLFITLIVVVISIVMMGHTTVSATEYVNLIPSQECFQGTQPLAYSIVIGQCYRDIDEDDAFLFGYQNSIPGEITMAFYEIECNQTQSYNKTITSDQCVQLTNAPANNFEFKVSHTPFNPISGPGVVFTSYAHTDCTGETTGYRYLSNNFNDGENRYFCSNGLPYFYACLEGECRNRLLNQCIDGEYPGCFN